MTSLFSPLRPTLRRLSLIVLLTAGLLAALPGLTTPALAQSEATADDDDSAAPAAAEPAPPAPIQGDDSSAWALVVHADPVVKAVILILLAFSLVSWAIILERWLLIRRAWTQSEAFLAFFWKTDSLELAHKQVDNYPDSPIAQVFAGGYRELRKLHAAGPGAGPRASGSDNVGRTLRRSASESLTRLERWIPFLASCGSAAPFIGLFGTVWGILLAFQKIGTTGTTSIAEVGPFIAEALIATAVGLFAAIPAVLFFNYFATRLKVLAAEINHFSFDFLNLVERHQRGRNRGA